MVVSEKSMKGYECPNILSAPSIQKYRQASLLYNQKNFQKPRVSSLPAYQERVLPAATNKNSSSIQLNAHKSGSAARLIKKWIDRCYTSTTPLICLFFSFAAFANKGKISIIFQKKDSTRIRITKKERRPEVGGFEAMIFRSNLLYFEGLINTHQVLAIGLQSHS